MSNDLDHPVRAATDYDSDEHDINLLNSSFEHDPPEMRQPWTGLQYPLLKQFIYTPGQSGVQREKHRDPMRGWQLVTTTSFEQGDIVVGMHCPAKCGSTRAWQKLRANHGWPSDAAVQCKAMPDLFDNREQDSDEEGEVKFSWRSGSSSPPDSLPDWYFLDHSHEPTVTPDDHLVKLWLPDGKLAQGVVWRANRHLNPGTVLTFRYRYPHSSWS